MSGDSTRLRMGILGVVVISLFSALLARLWYLQVLAAPTYQEEAQLNSVRFIYSEAPRGRIIDRNGKVLVGNRVVPTVVVDKSELGEKPDDVIRHLAALVKLPEALLKERIEDPRYSPFKPIPVVDDVPKETLIHIREHQDEYPGVQGVMLTKRSYPNGSLAAHVLGYVGEINDKELAPRKSKGYRPGDSIGKSGVELAYEDDLRGEPEVEKLEVDAQGRVLRSLGKQPAVQGHDVRLTIDLDLQRVAEESLQQSIAAAQVTYDNESAKRFIAPAGSAVVVDPRDGSVLAMASYPTYEPASFIDGISEKTFAALNDPAGHYPLNNRVTQGLYAPASTFKLVTSIAGLETGLITPQYTVNDRGTFTIGDPPTVLKNAFSEAFGYVNLSAALTVSSDVYFYELGSRFCPGRCRTSIQDTAKELGLGDFTEIELPVRGQRAHPRRSDQAAPPQLQPRRLPRPRVVHRRQPQPGHRAGRHRRHAPAAGQRLRHPGQRGHGLRPPRRRVDPRRERQRGAHGRTQGEPQDGDPTRHPRPGGGRVRGSRGRHPGDGRPRLRRLPPRRVPDRGQDRHRPGVGEAGHRPLLRLRPHR